MKNYNELLVNVRVDKRTEICLNLINYIFHIFITIICLMFY